MLVTQGDSRVPYNIISGDGRPALPNPTKPGSSHVRDGPMSEKVDRRKINQAFTFFH